MALRYGKMLIHHHLYKSLRFVPQLVVKRSTTSDFCNQMSGKREYVGYGVNGSPVYADLPEYPMPAIRFREGGDEFCALREKERGDWNKLTLDEIKKLYRGSFCQTFAEMQAPTGEWKLAAGISCWAMAIAILMTVLEQLLEPLPESFEEDKRQAQLKRMIALEMNPITGLASKWDYEVEDWKFRNNIGILTHLTTIIETISQYLTYRQIFMMQ
uniref:Cytochrome c oxidase subunit 4 n=1 Tax=Glossina austeni TaxID=7395 RepID=A0A1A9VTB5_GLOAU